MGLLLTFETPDPGPRTSDPRLVLSWMGISAGTLLCIQSSVGQHAHVQTIAAITLLIVGFTGLGLFGAGSARRRIRVLAVAVFSLGLFVCQAAGLFVKLKPEVRVGGVLLFMAVTWRLAGPDDGRSPQGHEAPADLSQLDHREPPSGNKKSD
ncbi:hypothetical protein VOLCADRAFT_107335 [Volvox carteri f. nagariensis]|uniref:Uncharacterized protein n=1 Tax=Volvox carteri f. nagariensis TaxID=3068 RepID=D8UDD1_VOLCA|nr:uncharacterized protein VOLCADRAFT_107335 [Volvox carteri f. nagariensis]EFJ42244.1 hypothetical protein VOLCADRAFT_107335 [Volvox carteri f. nagariensis]|eukprot:XP_002956642.1 hypothetical protein VOLCADRAFT_107335 [Volvox carteri f. nagariensis]